MTVKVTITITEAMRLQLVTADVITLAIDEDFINTIRAGVIRDIGEIWDFDEDVKGKEIYEMTRIIADKLEGPNTVN